MDGAAECVPLDKNLRVLDKNGNITSGHPDDIAIPSFNPGGVGSSPVWNLPSNTVYIAPPYILAGNLSTFPPYGTDRTTNTWEAVTGTITTTSTTTSTIYVPSSVPSSVTATGTYWIKT